MVGAGAGAARWRPRIAGSSIARAPRSICAGRREVEAGWRRQRPDIVIIAAATVGGIGANAARPADFLYDNLLIAANIIHAAHGNRASRSCCSSAPPASIRAMRRSRSSKTRCCPARSSRPTKPMRWPKSPASSYARPIAGNTAMISSAPCRAISTGRATAIMPQDSHVIPALLMKLRGGGAGAATMR